jgi:hypothetical protein
MKKLAGLLFLAMPGIWAQATTTTTYTLPPGVCVQIANCIIYGPGESFSLWTTPKWSIFNIYSWQNGFSVVDTFNCATQSYSSGPGSTGIVITAACSSADAHGVPFSMTYTVNAYSYYSRGGGGKGGGGAGTRWAITGGAVTISQ